MNQKISKYLNWALVGVLYLILLTPVLLSSKYLFPFITTKTMYFRLMVELAIILYVALAMLVPKFRPKMTKLSWAIVIFGIIIFLTGLTGVDSYKTFWGTIERGEGFLTISHLIIYFLILTWTFKSKKEWLNYLSGAVMVSLCVGFYAILQRANVEKFLWWRIIHPGEKRLSATIGNAAFMGAYTLANFFLSLLLILKTKNIIWKFIFAGITIINLYVLYQTQTRGAAISLITITILGCLFYLIKSPHKIKRSIAGAVLLAIILFGSLVWLNKDSDWVQESPMLRRLVTISPTDITTESRLLAIDTSWKGWKDRFILGYGWENYNIAYNKYFHAEIFKDAGSQLWFDRAHNTIFDVAVTTGIFGLINYLVIFGLALFYLFKHIKRDFDFSVILIAMLMAHFLQNIFVFDVLASYVTLFIIFAITNSIIIDQNHKPDEEISTTNTNFNALIFIPILIVVIFGAYLFNLKPLQANKIGVNALINANYDQEKQAIKLFQEAIQMNTYQTPELRQKLADNIIIFNNTKQGLSDKEVSDNFLMTINVVKNNITEHPWDVQNYLYLAAVLNKAASYNSAYYDQVILWAEKALELSPTRPQIYFEMGQALVSQKKYDEGIEYFKKGIELNPNTMESHWNLMTAYTLAGQYDKSDAEYELMKKNNYDFNSLNNLNRLYSIYLIVDRKDKLIETLEQIVEIKPSGTAYARLAAAYNEIGEIQKARKAVIKAVELDPSLAAEATKFLELLK